MADDRNSYKSQDITLELHTDDRSGGVPSAPDEVIIFQDKEVCYTTTSITSLPGDGWVEKTLSVTEVMTPVISAVRETTYYSKDITFEVQPDGDLYRIYNDSSIAAKIEAVCMTIKGSLYNEPGHGTYLYNFLFRMNPNVVDEIRLELETQIQMQVPQIKIDKITVEPTDRNAYSVNINFFNISSSNPTELLSMTNLVSIEQVIS